MNVGGMMIMIIGGGRLPVMTVIMVTIITTMVVMMRLMPIMSPKMVPTGRGRA